MKIFTRLFSFLIILIPFFTLGNVYVHGYVKYPNGTPVSGITVTIVSDSAVAQSICQLNHYLTTNDLGFYSDTLICPGTISQIKTWILDPCNLRQKTHIQTPSASSSVESNFIICDSSTSCSANFGWYNTAANQVTFYSNSSYGSTNVDTIISRTWDFGDGTSLNGNVISPIHTYGQTGNYTACVTIKTVFGCEKTYCETIQVAGNVACVPTFSWNTSTTIPYRISFNSAASIALAGDSIISRKWTFGDGDSLIGNSISPEHTYPNYSEHTACVTIKTTSGCEKTYCNPVQVPSNTVCNASSTWGYSQTIPYRILFNSIYSTAITGDSIISRTWVWGDGDTITGNVIAPEHTYPGPGTYTACLTIKSRQGCESTSCYIIFSYNATANCNATFNWSKSATVLSRVLFNSTASTAVTGDSIISRKWQFGDGDTLTGNVISPEHTYPGVGTYTACLTIKTRLGCEKTFCLPVQISVNTGCVANFNYNLTTLANTILLRSDISAAIAGDSIVSRIWRFGDGDSLSGNVIFPQHTYPTYGIFNPCLTIKTRLGCEKTICNAISLPDPAPNCRSYPYYNMLPAIATGYPVQFMSRHSMIIPGDSILHCQWTYGDSLSGSDSLHIYSQPGTYNACVTIQTASGCTSTACTIVTILPNRCEAIFNADSIATPSGGNAALHYYKFNSTNSHGITPGDSIISRKWWFGNGDSLTGNVVTPVYGYAQPGIYNLCLEITTVSGCQATICKTLVVGIYSFNCQPHFATMANALLVTFNGNTSTAETGDSIISRSWTFGDGSVSTSTAAVLTHQYPQAGTYTACLTIRTRLGCTSTICKSIAVVPVPGKCVPYFTKEQTTAARTIHFNSSAAYSQIPNDTIISRKWEFGDGQVLTGNVINPLHTYLHGGTYTACLTIYTAHCDKRWCQTVQVFPLDSTNTLDSVAIVNLYPVPVISPLYVLLYSSHPNINTQLAIYDVYGILKWTQNTVLPYGNSTYTIPSSQLAAGHYVFKVTTIYGVKSRSFYKMN